jgi:hypothetical protein
MPSKILAVLGMALAGVTGEALALNAPSLGKAASFAVLGNSVTNSGDSLVTGDLGFNDSNGVPREMMRLGAVQPRNSSLVRQAQRDAAAAYAALGQGPCTDPGPLPPLFPINATPVQIFCVNGDLTTAPNTAVQVIAGCDCNVFWQVAGNVTLGAGTVFVGTIIAHGRITLGAGASVSGRVIALGGDVALHDASVSVCCPQIVISTTLPLTASGGTPPYRFEVQSGSLPPGALSAAGTISATLPPGYYPFLAKATDAHRCAGVQTESVAVCPLTLSPLTLPRGKVGEQYEVPITVSGGSGSYSCNVSGLPDGMTFCPDMTLRGIPTKCDVYEVTVEVTDKITGCTVKQTYRLVICGITITPGTLPDGNVCDQYCKQLDPGCVIGKVTWEISGSLPDGLSFQNGLICGQPKATGTFRFMVRATDSESCSDEKTYDLTIRPAAPITVLPATLPNGTVDTPYLAQISASGGCCADYTFTADSIVPGLRLDPKSGALSGTPTTPGCFCVTVTADCKGNSVSKNYDVCFCGHLVLVPGLELPAATAHLPGVPYRRSVRKPESKGAFTFRVTGGNLLPWLNLSEDGVLYGTPGQTGAFTIHPTIVYPPGFTFTVTATDSVPDCPSVSEKYHVPVFACDDVPTIKTTSLPNGTVGFYPSTPIVVDSGPSPHTLSIVSGSAGELTLNGDSLQSAPPTTPTTPGTFCFSVVATNTDTSCSSTPQDYTVVISQPTCPLGPTITVTPATLPPPIAGTFYCQQLTATGGTAPYTFSVSAGALPDCLKLDPKSGAICGIPNRSGPYEFTIIATDANGCVSARCPERLVVLPGGGMD